MAPRRTVSPVRSAAVVLVMLALAAGCKREERGVRVTPPAAATVQSVRLSPLQVGVPTTYHAVENPYEQNAYAMSEGQRIFEQFNCVGCHGHGGGGMGPALMDDKWIYGSNPEQIFATIVQGRPNGMPSFSGKISDFQVWQVAAYVRSLSGLVPATAAPARSDHMTSSPPGNSKDPELPVPVQTPR